MDILDLKQQDHFIKIRPLWDWNSNNAPKTLFILLIKIRPLWDWNLIYLALGIRLTALIKIRPLWDWNLECEALPKENLTD